MPEAVTRSDQIQSILGSVLTDRLALWLSHPERQSEWLAGTDIADLAEAYCIVHSAIDDIEGDGGYLSGLAAQSLRGVRDMYVAEAIRRGKTLHEGNNIVATVAGQSMAREIRRRLESQ